MSYTFISSADALDMYGAGVSSTATADTDYLEWVNEMSEAAICAITGFDWIGDYSSLDANIKFVLGRCAGMMMALEVMLYDTKGYLEGEISFKANYYADQIKQMLATLSETKTKEVLGAE